MSQPSAEPSLVDFVRGYSGPSDARFRGGSISIDAALIYTDGVRIEWRMPAETDLSWIDDATGGLKSPSPALSEQQAVVRGRLKLDRVIKLWSASRLADDRGGLFELSIQRVQLLSHGWYGVAICACSSPDEAREFTLHIGDSRVVIGMSANQEQRDLHASQLRAGVPGPREAFAFHGGAVRIISVLLYGERVAIEWLLDPLPDLSWLDRRDPLTSAIDSSHETNHLESARNPTLSYVGALWFGAHLADNRKTSYQGSLGDARGARSGYRGEVHFRPTVPESVTELRLVLYELSIVLALRI